MTETTFHAFKIEDYGDLSHGQLRTMARTAEAAERYDDMCTFMKALVVAKGQDGAGFNVEERNLLSVAYKNVVGARRAAWRMLAADAQSSEEAEIVNIFKKEVELELTSICNEVLDLLKDKLLQAPSVKGSKDEAEVFFLKMAGDYYRYMCEFAPDQGHEAQAKEYYQTAMDIAKEALAETHPTRLGLALNFSVCHYEILKDQEEACKLAKQAFDDAIAKLDSLDESSYKDSTLIMQLLRDNLTLWTTEPDPENAEDGAEE